jgi:hypothetical protein
LQNDGGDVEFRRYENASSGRYFEKSMKICWIWLP